MVPPSKNIYTQNPHGTRLTFKGLVLFQPIDVITQNFTFVPLSSSIEKNQLDLRRNSREVSRQAAHITLKSGAQVRARASFFLSLNLIERIRGRPSVCRDEWAIHLRILVRALPHHPPRNNLLPFACFAINMDLDLDI